MRFGGPNAEAARNIVLALGPGFALSAAAFHLLRKRHFWQLEGRCTRCGYLLTGLAEPRCPECGTPFDPALLARLSADAEEDEEAPPESRE